MLEEILSQSLHEGARVEPQATDQQVASKREHDAQRGGDRSGSMVTCASQPQPDQQ